MEINPITQRCNTISTKHHFDRMYEKKCVYTKLEADAPLREILQEVYSFRTNKALYKCAACGLVDDVYEGKYD